MQTQIIKISKSGKRETQKGSRSKFTLANLSSINNNHNFNFSPFMCSISIASVLKVYSFSIEAVLKEYCRRIYGVFTDHFRSTIQSYFGINLLTYEFVAFLGRSPPIRENKKHVNAITGHVKSHRLLCKRNIITQ